jgi:hypothetical protein
MVRDENSEVYRALNETENEHANAVASFTSEIQELQKSLQERDLRIKNVKEESDQTFSKLQNELKENKNQQVEDVTHFATQLQHLSESLEDREDQVNILEGISSGMMKTLKPQEETYDVTVAYNQAGYQSRMLEEAVKRSSQKNSYSSWFYNSSAVASKATLPAADSGTPRTDSSASSTSISDDVKSEDLSNSPSIPPMQAFSLPPILDVTKQRNDDEDDTARSDPSLSSSPGGESKKIDYEKNNNANASAAELQASFLQSVVEKKSIFRLFG